MQLILCKVCLATEVTFCNMLIDLASSILGDPLIMMMHLYSTSEFSNNFVWIIFVITGTKPSKLVLWLMRGWKEVICIKPFSKVITALTFKLGQSWLVIHYPLLVYFLSSELTMTLFRTSAPNYGWCRTHLGAQWTFSPWLWSDHVIIAYQRTHSTGVILQEEWAISQRNNTVYFQML